MKYAVFTVAALGMPVLAAMLYVNRRLMRWVVWGMIGALCVYSATAINFFSNEEYRGSARGMEVSVVYLLSFAILLALAMRRRLNGFFPEWGYRIYFAYFLVCLPSLAAVADGLIAWYEIWKMLMLFLCYRAVYGYLRAGGGVMGLLGGFACFTLINALVVVKQHYGGVYQARGVFPHQNCMAMAMSLMAPLFLAVYLQGGLRGAFRKLCTLAFLASLVSVAWSYSRGALVAAPTGCALTVMSFFVKRRRNVGRTVRRLLPFVLAGMVGVALVLPRVVERFKKAPEASANTRVEFARCAWEMIKDEPLTGIGINNWGIKINAPYEYAIRAGRTLNYPEGYKDGIVETVYLLVCAECGIPALLAMLCWFGWYWVSCIRLMGKMRDSTLFFIPAGLFGGLSANYLQSFLEWVLRQQLNLILLMSFYATLAYLNTEWRRIIAAEKAKKNGN